MDEEDAPTGAQGRQQVGIQDAMGARGRSSLEKYQDLVVGSRSLARLILHELVVTLTSWVPGALGLVLRKAAYPLLPMGTPYGYMACQTATSKLAAYMYCCWW